MPPPRKRNRVKTRKTPEARNAIPKKLQDEVYRKKGLVCHLCGLEIPRNLSHPHPESKSLDHLMPYSHGGPDTFENLSPAHLRCNIERKDKSLDPYRSGIIAQGMKNRPLKKVVKKGLVVQVGIKYYQPTKSHYSSWRASVIRFKRFLWILMPPIIFLAVISGFLLLGLLGFFLLCILVLLVLLGTRPPKNRYGNRGKRKWKIFDGWKDRIARNNRKVYLARCVTTWEELEIEPQSFVVLNQTER